ncbi:MAG: universal stress protein [Rhodobacteraceae bacterium]|nr:MAG: universal stress protein [Paracoccaceae bacterium]
MRKFLVVMDDSPEFVNALRFAAIRASKTGGQVEILGIIAPEEFQHWLGVAEQMKYEAKERIKEHFKIFSEIIEKEEGIIPELVIREGDKVTEVLAQVQEDPEVGIIVLGAGISSEGPGPLVTQLVARQGGTLPVPVTIVPGSLTKDSIISVS